jgi:hypothetical protein
VLSRRGAQRAQTGRPIAIPLQGRVIRQIVQTADGGL